MKRNAQKENSLDNGEYKKDLDELFTHIIKGCKNSKNEAEVASAFENNLYSYVYKKFGIKLKIDKERRTIGLNHKFGALTKRKSGRGKIDAVVNNLLIEYKSRAKLNNEREIKEAFEQTKDYLESLKKNEEKEYDAILTNGEKIAYFHFSDEKIESTALRNFKVKDLDTIIQAILSNNSKKFVSENILYDFSISPNVESDSKMLANSLYHELNTRSTEKTRMLFSEWQVLMHLSANDNGKSGDIEKRRNDLSLLFNADIKSADMEYVALYALQTTYAIIVKLIACKVIDRLNYNKNSNTYKDLTNITSSELQKFISNMEDGYSYKNNNINNFLEGDFFSWYSDKNQWTESLYKSILPLIMSIDTYSSFSLNVVYEPIDIFKDLYMSIIPKSIRHSMGEYFTPGWLAEYVVNNAAKMTGNRNWKAIDPCCGSGIFILALIKKIVGGRQPSELSDQERVEIRNDVLSRVHGIDINPLSVLSARVGYYMALLPFGKLQDEDIPVYLGDSAIIPYSVKIGQTECYQYSITNLKIPFDVVLPKSFVHKKDFLKTMCQLQALIKAESTESLVMNLVENFDTVDKANTALVEKIGEFAEKLVCLYKNQWDGIWIKIISNFMLIANISDIDIIVGNPPWVKWEHLPAKYAQKIKDTCSIKHIFCNDGGQYGGTQLNICALIANMTASNWLTKKGVLAFLMPDSIMSQNSYEEFRNFYIDYKNKTRLFLQKIDKWEKPLRPFQTEDSIVSQDFNTYYYKYDYVNYSEGVPVTTISKDKSMPNSLLNQMKQLEAVLPSLIIGSTKAVQLSNKTTAFSFCSETHDFSQIIGESDYLYRTGVEFTPQEIYMLKSKEKSKKNGFHFFEKKKFLRAKYKVEDVEQGRELPTEFIYPMLTAPNIVPFGYTTDNEFCIVPYDEEHISSPVDQATLLKTNKELYIYLCNNKSLIDQQSEKSKQMHRGKEFYSLSKIGPYTFAKNIVAARDNTRFCATVVNKERTPWGEIKQTICVKHTIVISQRKDRSFITKDEAYYICGVLNCDIVGEYIHNSFKTNGFSLNKSSLYLPKYDNLNEIHRQIAQISKNASTGICDAKTAMKNISALYIKICEKKM